MQTTSVLRNMRSAHVASSVRFSHKVRKQRRQTEQLGLKAGLKNDLRTAWIYPRPSGSTAPSHSSRHLNSPRCRWRHSVPSVIHSPRSFKLICSSPGFALLNHHTFPRSRVCSLGTSSRPRPVSAHVRVHPSSRQASPTSVLLASPRLSGHKARCQRCVLLTPSCLFVNLNRRSRPLVSATSGPLTHVSSATLNANLERPSVLRQLALFKHSCISFWSKCFVSMSVGLSTPGTFTMVSSRRATASCTHKTWAWRCLTRPTPRLKAIAFDAVASTRTRGCTTFCHVSSHSHCAQSSRCTLGSTRKIPLHLSFSPPHFELLPTKQRDARQASRTKTKSTVGSSHILPNRCLRRRPRLAVQLVCCTQSSISDFPSGIAPDV